MMEPSERDTVHSTLCPSTLTILRGYESLILSGNSKASAAADPTGAGTFCDRCKVLLWSYKGFEIGVGDVRDISALEEEASKGCQACSMFRANLSALSEDFWLRKFEGKPHVFVSAVPEMPLLPPALLPDSITPLRFVIYSAEEVSHLVNPADVETSTASQSSFRLARGWIRECWMSHASCRPAQGNMPYRPTRLLDVSGTSRLIRMREKDEVPDDVVYVTLSHCWGSHVPYQLTTRNIDCLKKALDLDLLGKTFQDAVEVARRLAVQYIWVDCLCIIQDSKEDWARESVVMQHVYGNSFCNIAATSSSDSLGGCFRHRNPEVIKPVRINFENVGGSPGSECVYLTDINLWWTRFEQSPLNQRAWIFQERLLSPRILHFDEDQLAWECNELTACERFPMGTGELITKPNMRLPLEKIFQEALASGLQGLEIHDIWRPIVCTYSSTKIKYDSDRLIAIYGVAMKIKKIFGCQYAAGLFSRKMESQLLWHVIDHNTSYRPIDQIAPSWSWASVAGAVDLLPQWESLNVLQHDIATKDQFQGKSPREAYYCDILNKDTLGLGASSPMISHDILDIQCFIIPAYYVTFSETQSWKKCNYKLTFDRIIAADEPNPERGFTRGTQADIPSPGEDWPLEWDAEGGSIDTGTFKTYTIYHGSIYSTVLVSTVQGDEDRAIHINLRYDVVSDFRTGRKRWLLPVYESTDWYAEAIFDLVSERTVSGLVLEQCADGEPRFHRLGVFKILEDDVNRFLEECLTFEGPEEWQRMPWEAVWEDEDKEETEVVRLQAKQYRVIIE